MINFLILLFEYIHTLLYNNYTRQNTFYITMTTNYTAICDGFRKHGIGFFDALTPKPILNFIMHANKLYTEGTPFLTDSEYDTIIDYAKQRKNLRTKLDGIIGSPVGNDTRKVQLPYFMGSMNKIKPNPTILEHWKKDFPEPYCISAKLDGVSGLYVFSKGIQKLYTRGNGAIGQDISNLIPYFKLPSLPNTETIVVRGEFIIPKNDFTTHYQADFSNARNMVAGLINTKYVEPSKYQHIHFVTYEVIQPSLKPSEAFIYLNKMGFKTVTSSSMINKQKLTTEFLSKTLVMWRNNLPYEIDGVIVVSDAHYQRKNENPKHAFAFKMVLDDQRAETNVLDVIWTPSKDGYLKPRIHINPVSIGGATIEYVTGFNGKYIQDNGIGPGATISLIRSGDVIPHITGILHKVQPKMPKEDYVWNDTHIDILLKNKENNVTVLMKQFTLFFQRCGAKQIGEGIIMRFIENGYTDLPSILNITKENIIEMEGFQEKSANNLLHQFEMCKKCSLLTLIFASSILGRGIGYKKLEVVLQNIPELFTTIESDEDKIQKIEQLPGFAHKTAIHLVSHIPKLIQWFDEMDLKHKLHEVYSVKANIQSKQGKLTNCKICITGFRNKELEAYITTNGGSLQASVNKSTNILIVKSTDTISSKVKKAKELNIPIMSYSEFIQTYSI